MNPKVARVDRSTSTVSATADVFPKLVEAIAVPYSGAIREFHKIFVFVVPLLALAYVGFLWYILFAVLELWSGYSIAIWYFGYPPDKSVR